MGQAKRRGAFEQRKAQAIMVKAQPNTNGRPAPTYTVEPLVKRKTRGPGASIGLIAALAMALHGR